MDRLKGWHFEMKCVDDCVNALNIISLFSIKGAIRGRGLDGEVNKRYWPCVCMHVQGWVGLKRERMLVCARQT
jgi:hypothetical protein